jgi:hypothetical protein
MQVIFTRQVAEQLSDRYTVLELETFTLPEGQILETFCVVPADKMNLAELPTLDDDKRQHNEFIQQLKDKNYTYCESAAPDLMGKFGGELDSFYEIILERCRESANQ